MSPGLKQFTWKAFGLSVLEHTVAIGLATAAGWLATRLKDATDHVSVGLTLWILVFILFQWGLTKCFMLYYRRRIREQERVRLTAAMEDMQKRVTLEHEAQLEQLSKTTLGNFAERTQEHHQFVHVARDLLVYVLSAKPVQRRKRNRSLLASEHLPYVEEMLLRMANAFQLLLPVETKVYAAIRERRGSEYVTICRAGKVDSAARQKTSDPLHRETRIVTALVDSFKNGDCVLRTGSLEPTWQPRKNDQRGEDLSVLLGAVFTKKFDHKRDRDEPFAPLGLEWIVGVAANKQGAFNDKHKSLMKCFNDVFGIVLNILARESQEENGPGNGNTTKSAP